MILYLFGGYSNNTERKHWKLINTYLEKINPKQILFIGAAELKKTSIEVFLRFKSKLRSKFNTEILNAANKNDLKQIKYPLVFVGGGDGHVELHKFITDDIIVYKSILGCNYYFGDSAGSMIVGSQLRRFGDGSGSMRGLNILKKTIIEPHFSQWNRHQQLKKELNHWNCNIGIGIDEVTAIKIYTDLFPKKYEILGSNKVKVIEKF